MFSRQAMGIDAWYVILTRFQVCLRCQNLMVAKVPSSSSAATTEVDLEADDASTARNSTSQTKVVARQPAIPAIRR
jgi:hypothetical protein